MTVVRMYGCWFHQFCIPSFSLSWILRVKATGINGGNTSVCLTIDTQSQAIVGLHIMVTV